MKKTLAFVVTAFLVISLFGQNFEGEIVYANSYISKKPNVSDDRLMAMMGAVQEYYIKGGDYKSVCNGSYFQWQLYINKDNKIYNKTANSDAVYWDDGARNEDTILKTELNKGVTEILGYMCDELILTCKNDTQKYYFNSKLSVDSKLFVNHKYGNWYDYLLLTHALPLKTVIDNGQFTMVSTAIEVKKIRLDKKMFQLHADSQVVKNAY